MNVNPSYKTEELAYVLEKCEIRAIVAETEYGLQTFQVYLNEYLSTGKGPTLFTLCEFHNRVQQVFI